MTPAMRLFGLLSAAHLSPRSLGPPQHPQKLLPTLATHASRPKPPRPSSFRRPIPHTHTSVTPLPQRQLCTTHHQKTTHCCFVLLRLATHPLCQVQIASSAHTHKTTLLHSPELRASEQNTLAVRTSRRLSLSQSFPQPSVLKNARTPDSHPCQHTLQGTEQTSRSPRDPRHRLARPCKK